jgi:murein endopeptidase
MIAARYDEAPRWLRKWNRIEKDEKLRLGRRLSVRARRLPPPLEAREYVARAGDTVRSVARRHGIDVWPLARQLHKKKDAALDEGESLQLWVDPTLLNWLDSLPPDALASGGLGGSFGVGAPDDGYLANGVAIPEDPAWQLRFPHQSYGDSYAVEAVVAALHDFRDESEYTGPLRLWSMSRRYGGPLVDHDSHQSGRDIDIKLPLRADLPGTLAVKPEWVDYRATWELIDALARTGAVQEIFLDHAVQIRVEAAAAELGATEARRRELISAPRPRLSKAGLVRHFDGHADHLHVRFRCAPWGVYCTDR